MRLLLVSGGSVGHLAPLVAVERAFRELHSDAETLFLCSDRPEDAAFLQKEGVTFRTIPLPKRSLRLLWRFVQNFLQSRRILRDFHPDIVFSKGGAVSVPCCLAAKLQHIPIVLHESDAVMGRANAMVARIADRVCMGMEGKVASDELPVTSYQLPVTSDLFSKLETRNSKLVFTGNPIRSELTQGSHEEGLRITGLSGKRPILLVYGGSQGAQVINEAVSNHLDALLAHCDIVHLTGKGKKGASPQAGYWSTEFAHEELSHLYAIADLAVSRAGASNIGELAANGIPTILVPIAGLANDHQVKNAEMSAASGGCIHLPQVRLDAEIVSMVVTLADHAEKRAQMSRSILSLSHPEAARRIAEILSKRIALDRDAH